MESYLAQQYAGDFSRYEYVDAVLKPDDDDIWTEASEKTKAETVKFTLSGLEDFFTERCARSAGTFKPK
ncbi:TNN, partial [Symbiodinium microadriaticum]